MQIKRTGRQVADQCSAFGSPNQRWPFSISPRSL